MLKLPSISNFSDLDPLETEASVRLRWVSPGDPLGQPDAVLLPGSKQTLRDLEALRSSGLDRQLVDFTHRGGSVLAICGGMQLLGQNLHDPDHLEGGDGAGPWPGLGLLPLTTQFGGTKACLLYTSPSPRDGLLSRMPSSA